MTEGGSKGGSGTRQRGKKGGGVGGNTGEAEDRLERGRVDQSNHPVNKSRPYGYPSSKDVVEDAEDWGHPRSYYETEVGHCVKQKKCEQRVWARICTCTFSA